MNLELCYDEFFHDFDRKYGLKAKEKYGDIIINNKFQENLEKVVE